MASRGKPAEPRRPAPRLYLVTPPHADGLSDKLAESLAVTDVAAVLLRLPQADERSRIELAKALAPRVQDRGAALLLDGAPTVLISRGEPDAEALGRSRVSLEDVLESARRQHGLRRLDEVEFAVLEIGGKISIVPRKEG